MNLIQDISRKDEKETAIHSVVERGATLAHACNVGRSKRRSSVESRPSLVDGFLL